MLKIILIMLAILGALDILIMLCAVVASGKADKYAEELSMKMQQNS